MKNLNINKKCLIATIFILFSTSAFTCCLPLYIGADKQLNKMRFKEGYGNNVFFKSHPQANFYAGIKFRDSLSFEGGYISTISKNKLSTFHEGDCLLGAMIARIVEPVRTASYIKIKGCHLSLLKTYYPEFNENFRFSGGIGIAFLKAEAQRNTISLGRPPVPGNVRTFQKRKAVLRLLGASEYKFHEQFGIRASICFMQTSKMVMRARPTKRSAFNPIIRPKDSFIYSLGLFFEF